MNPFAASYLYGVDRPIHRSVVEAYVTALVAVARSDGLVESESRIIQGVAKILGAPPFTVSRAMENDAPGQLERAISVLRGRAPELLDLLYRDAVLVSRADGHLSREETTQLMRISTELGLDHARRKRAIEAADRLEALRDWTRGLIEASSPPTVVG